MKFKKKLRKSDEYYSIKSMMPLYSIRVEGKTLHVTIVIFSIYWLILAFFECRIINTIF